MLRKTEKKFCKFYVHSPEYLDVKTCGRGGKSRAFLTSSFFAVVKDQLHAVAALPRGRVSGTHSARRWVNLRADLEVVVKIKF
jgi:hypothetical protein